MNSKKIGNFLKQLREENNLTQDDLSSKIYVSREAISKWERGINIPKTDQLLSISKLYNISINEILYGERKTNNNKEKIETLANTIYNRDKKQIKILFILLTIIIFTLLLTYFINNFNSIKIYKLSSNTLELDNTFFFISPEKTYLNIGNINNDIEKLEVYYELNDNKYKLYSTNTTPILYMNNFGKDEGFRYKDYKKILNNLYLKIYYQDYTDTLKLDYKLDYQNNSFTNFIKNIFDNNKISLYKELTKINLENFIYNENTKEYEYSYQEDNTRYDYKYEKESEILILKVNDKETYTYLKPSNLLIYNSNEINFTYDLKNNICLENPCDLYYQNIEFIQKKLIKLLMYN